MGKFALLRYLIPERVSTKGFVVLIIGNSRSNHSGAQGTFNEDRKGFEWHLLTLHQLSTAVNATAEALARAHREYGVTEAVRLFPFFRFLYSFNKSHTHRSTRTSACADADSI